MMTYHRFINRVINELRKAMPDEYKDCRLQFYQEAKVNEQMDFIEVMPIDTTILKVAPRIPIQPLYECYIECKNMNAVIQVALENIKEGFQTGIKGLSGFDLENIKQQIVFLLIHGKQNEALLKKVPHRLWHDLAIVYRWIINAESDLSSILDNNMMNQIGMDEEDLFREAALNTMRLYPPRIESHIDVIKNRLGDFNDIDDVQAILGSFIKNEQDMYIISNQNYYYGATGVLYENILFEVAQLVGGNLFLLPSSLHEMIAVKANDDPESMVEMVKEINYHEVPIKEQLSNQVYLYDMTTRNVTMVTDISFDGFDSISE